MSLLLQKAGIGARAVKIAVMGRDAQSCRRRADKVQTDAAVVPLTADRLDEKRWGFCRAGGPAL